MRRRLQSKRVLARDYRFVVLESASRSKRGIIDKDHGSDDAADGFGSGRKSQPLIEGAAFVRLEVAEADLTKCLRIDDLRNSLANLRKQLLHAGFK